MSIRQELEQEGKLCAIEPRGDDEDTRFKSLERPNISLLSADERQEVDHWILMDREQTASSISKETDNYPWEIAAMGEELPYSAQFAIRIRAPKGKELDWARKVTERLKPS
jgi:hypothetical protein